MLLSPSFPYLCFPLPAPPPASSSSQHKLVLLSFPLIPCSFPTVPSSPLLPPFLWLSSHFLSKTKQSISPAFSPFPVSLQSSWPLILPKYLSSACPPVCQSPCLSVPSGNVVGGVLCSPSIRDSNPSCHLPGDSPGVTTDTVWWRGEEGHLFHAGGTSSKLILNFTLFPWCSDLLV